MPGCRPLGSSTTTARSASGEKQYRRDRSPGPYVSDDAFCEFRSLSVEPKAWFRRIVPLDRVQQIRGHRRGMLETMARSAAREPDVPQRGVAVDQQVAA